jgi:hypothetical protein
MILNDNRHVIINGRMWKRKKKSGIQATFHKLAEKFNEPSKWVKKTNLGMCKLIHQKY